MTIEWQIIIGLSLAIVILFLLWRRARRRLLNLSFAKQSLSSKYGKMTEQFLPFLADYPYDPQRFRFLGSPVDGVQFADDKIIFVEFKIDSSRLTSQQRRIEDLIRQKKVAFEERRLDYKR